MYQALSLRRWRVNRRDAQLWRTVESPSWPVYCRSPRLNSPSGCADTASEHNRALPRQDEPSDRKTSDRKRIHAGRLQSRRSCFGTLRNLRTALRVLSPMNYCRTLLSVLLGLVLLVQGLAVSAAPHASPMDTVASLPATAHMPCHAQNADAADTQAAAKPSCCDASCPDMTSCALGHMAVSAPTGIAPLPANAAEYPVPASVLVSHPLRSPLRPPIAIHA